MVVHAPLEPFRLDGKVALVTGASSGLGDRFARVLAGAGAKVAVSARRSDRLEALTTELPDSLAVTADLAEPGAAEELVESTIDHFGGVDVVVNNAGYSSYVPALDYPTEDFRREIEVDLIAPYALARRAAIAMIEQERAGSIVNIGSILGSVAGGRLRVPGYAAAKGGLHHLTRELAVEWARKGVRVNAIAPGWFRSEMSVEIWTTDAGNAYVENGTPMGRGGEPDELDGALLFLASDASTYVTGQILHVDGGWTAM